MTDTAPGKWDTDDHPGPGHPGKVRWYGHLPTDCWCNPIVLRDLVGRDYLHQYGGAA